MPTRLVPQWHALNERAQDLTDKGQYIFDLMAQAVYAEMRRIELELATIAGGPGLAVAKWHIVQTRIQTEGYDGEDDALSALAASAAQDLHGKILTPPCIAFDPFAGTSKARPALASIMANAMDARPMRPMAPEPG